MIILYYKSCPNCKNYERNMVREVSLQGGWKYDDRFVQALPEIWGKEVDKIGTKLPFLYYPETGESLFIDHEDASIREKIKAFFLKDPQNADQSDGGTSDDELLV